MNIQIPITLLRSSNHIHQLLDGFIQLLTLPLYQKITGSLNPLRYIAVPKQMVGDGPHIRFIAVGGVPYQLKGIVTAGGFEDGELGQEGSFLDGKATAGYEGGVCEFCVDE